MLIFELKLKLIVILNVDVINALIGLLIQWPI